MASVGSGSEATPFQRRNRKVNSPSRTTRPVSSLATSSPVSSNPPRKKVAEKKPPKVKEEDKLWAVRGILNERIKGGVLEYLCDWVDIDPATGKRYEPEWIIHSNCLPGLVNEWKSDKANRFKGPDQTDDSPESVPDSQPIRPAKRRRLRKSVNNLSAEIPPSKRQRRSRSNNSTITIDSESPRPEQRVITFEKKNKSKSEGVIKDSYENGPSSELQGHSKETDNLKVEVSFHESFDRDNYVPVLGDSQFSQIQEIFDSSQTETPIASGKLQSTARDFSYIIPDSQEEAPSSSYRPTQTQISVDSIAQGQSSILDISATVLEKSSEEDPISFSSKLTDTQGSVEGPTQNQSGVVDNSTSEVVTSSSTEDRPSEEIPLGSAQVDSQTEEAEHISTGGNYVLEENSSCSDPEFTLLEQTDSHEHSSSEHSKTPLSESQSAASKGSPEKNIYSTSFQAKSGAQPPSASRDPSENSVTLETLGQSYSGEKVIDSSLHAALDLALQQENRTAELQDFIAASAEYITVHHSLTPLPRSSPTEDSLGSPKAISEPREDLPASSSRLHLFSVPSEGRAQAVEAFSSPVLSPVSVIAEDPFHFPDTYGSNPPSRPSTPERSVMEDRISQASPSRGDALLAPKPSEISMLPPTGFGQLVPSVAQPAPKLLAHVHSSAEPVSRSLDVLVQGVNSYAVPLSLSALTRSIYTNHVALYKNQRLAYITETVIDGEVVKDIDEMIVELGLICDYHDLISDSDYVLSQREETPATQARIAENVSTKCIFLAELLPLMQHSSQHVVIVARSGRMIDTIATLLAYHNLSYSNADHPNPGHYSSDEPLKVTLLSSTNRGVQIHPASVIIAFDSSAFATAYLKDLRTGPEKHDFTVPVLSLITAFSIEHLDKCFSTDIESTERKIQLVSCLSQLKERCGKLESPPYHDPPAAAAAVADYFVNGPNERPWPLRPMPIIDGLILDSDSSEDTSGPRSQEGTTQSLEDSHSLPAINPLKHELSIEGTASTGSPKRAKYSPVVELEGTGPSPMSDTVLRTSSGPIPPIASGPGASIAQAGAIEEPTLRQKIIVLESRIRGMEATDAELRQINQDLEVRCTDLETSIKNIQPKYQEALNEQGSAENQMKLATEKEARLRKQYDANELKLAKVAEEKGAAITELAKFKQLLKDSPERAIAQIAELEEELAKVKLENERLRKHSDSLRETNEFTTSRYQEASNSAAELAMEVQELKSKVVGLEEKASANRVRIHEIQNDNEKLEILKQLRGVKAERDGLERELERKNEELKVVYNGRRGTRGTSVPRSPRLGTMSPRQLGRSAMGTTTGSRGNSPAPGDVGVSGVANGFERPGGRWGPSKMS